MSLPQAASLLATQNPDGGWPTYEGRRSNTEATSLATLALAELDGVAPSAAAERGVRWLLARQNADGSWPLNDRIVTGSWTTALATLTLAALDREQSRALRGARWLLRQHPRKPGIVLSVLQRFAPDAAPVVPEGARRA